VLLANSPLSHYPSPHPSFLIPLISLQHLHLSFPTSNTLSASPDGASIKSSFLLSAPLATYYPPPPSKKNKKQLLFPHQQPPKTACIFSIDQTFLAPPSSLWTHFILNGITSRVSAHLRLIIPALPLLPGRLLLLLLLLLLLPPPNLSLWMGGRGNTSCTVAGSSAATLTSLVCDLAESPREQRGFQAHNWCLRSYGLVRT